MSGGLICVQVDTDSKVQIVFMTMFIDWKTESYEDDNIPRLMYRIYAIPVKSPPVFFIEIERLILQFIQKHMKRIESKQSYKRTKLEGSLFLISSLLRNNSDEDSVGQGPGQTQALLAGMGQCSKGKRVTQHKGADAW